MFSETRIASPARTRPLFLGACGGMFVFGLVLAVLGTVFGLPEMRDRLHVDLAQEGNIFLAFYLGLLLSNFVAGPLIDSIGNKLVLLVSSLLVALSLVGFAGAHSFAAAAVTAFVLGFGGSGLNTSTNALVSAVYAAKRGAMLNLLGFFFGFGALFVPLLAAAITGRFTVPQLLILSAALPLACAGVYAVLVFPPGARGGKTSFLDTLRVARWPGMLALTAVLFFQSANEASIGGWTSTYVGAHGLSPRTATLVLACYWATLMLMRIVTARLLARLGKPQMILAAGLGAVLGCILMLSAHSVAMLALGTCVIGASFSPIFPTTLGIAGDRYPQSVGSVFGMMFAVSLIGGMLAPWGVGHIAQHYAVRYGMFIPLACALGISAIAAGLVRAQARAQAREQGSARQEASGA